MKQKCKPNLSLFFNYCLSCPLVKVTTSLMVLLPNTRTSLIYRGLLKNSWQIIDQVYLQCNDQESNFRVPSRMILLLLSNVKSSILDKITKKTDIHHFAYVWHQINAYIYGMYKQLHNILWFRWFLKLQVHYTGHGQKIDRPFFSTLNQHVTFYL